MYLLDPYHRLDPSPWVSPEGIRALEELAALLKGLPHALMERQSERRRRGVGDIPAGTSEGSGSESGSGGSLSEPPPWMPELAVSESLMLAVYPGGFRSALDLDGSLLCLVDRDLSQQTGRG